MADAICLPEWIKLIEETEAFSIILDYNPHQKQIIILLQDEIIGFGEDDWNEVIETWKELDKT